MFSAGMFNIQRLQELKVYCNLLEDDSTMPKRKIEKAIDMMEKEQERIAMIDAQAKLMQQQVSQFLNSDAEAQAQTIADNTQEVATADAEGSK